MKNLLASTNNVKRFLAACQALEARLSDDSIVGLGLVYGRPGLGKTLTMTHYHSLSARKGLIQTYMVRALSIWTETSMLKDLLLAVGQAPSVYRKDVCYAELQERLRQRPAVFLIDQIDAVAEKRTMVSILHDLHDNTSTAFLMIGEDRVDGILRRYTAFYSRINTSALVRMGDPTLEDVQEVIEKRCDYPVAPEVVVEVHRMVGQSMRLVVDMIRSLEWVARMNQRDRIGMAELRKVLDSRNGISPISRNDTDVQAVAHG